MLQIDDPFSATFTLSCLCQCTTGAQRCCYQLWYSPTRAWLLITWLWTPLMMCSILHSHKTDTWQLLNTKCFTSSSCNPGKRININSIYCNQQGPHFGSQRTTLHLTSPISFRKFPCQAASQMLRAAMDRLDSQSAALPLASPGIHRAAPSHQRSVQNPQRRQSCRPIALPHRSLIRIVCKHHFEIQGGWALSHHSKDPNRTQTDPKSDL